MASSITTAPLVKPGTPSPSRVNAPASIRGQAGVKLLGGPLANSLAGDLEGLSSAVNALFAVLQGSPAVSSTGYTGSAVVRNSAGTGTSTFVFVDGICTGFTP